MLKSRQSLFGSALFLLGLLSNSSAFLLPASSHQSIVLPRTSRSFASGDGADSSNETIATIQTNEEKVSTEDIPSPVAPSSPSQERSIDELVAELEVDRSGVSAPLGFFDPLGFYKDATLKQKKKLREAELKHGRVAMLATLGIVTVEKFNFHPFFGFDTYDMGPACDHWQLLSREVPDFWLFLGFIVSSMEMKNIIKGWDPIEETVFAEGGPKLAGLRTDVISGDLDFDPLGLCPEESKIFLDLRTRELNNGRLAMIAALGMLIQEKFVTGQPIFH